MCCRSRPRRPRGRIWATWCWRGGCAPPRRRTRPRRWPTTWPTWWFTGCCICWAGITRSRSRPRRWRPRSARSLHRSGFRTRICPAMEPELEIPEHPPAAPQARRANWWPRLIAAGAALIAGAGAAVVHSPFSLWLGLLGYPLLMILFERAGTGRGAFGLGWLAGFAYFFISCWWVAEAFLVNAEAHAWMAPFAASLLPAGLALFWGLAGVLHRRLAPRTALRPLFFAAVFCGLEWLRGHVLTGFPWIPAGAGWAAGSAPSQAAAWLGVYGLGFVTVAAAAALAPLFGPGSIKARLGVAVLGLVALGALFVAGEVRLAGARPTLTPTVVRNVQAAAQQQAKWDEANFNAI